MNTAALELDVNIVYVPQLSLKKPGFLCKTNICLHLLQLFTKNVIGGFALVQIYLQYLYHIGGMAILESGLVSNPNIKQVV